MYRRVLGFEPSAELVKRVDELLSQQGSPEERLSLYKNALERETDHSRRRELLHSMAALQRRELDDPAGALQTWQNVLTEDPKDLTAHQALLDARQAAGDWDGVYAELARTLEHLEGERRSVTLLRMAEVSAEHGQPGRALGHYRELMQSAELADDVLDSIEQLARSEDDHKTTRAVLERRLERARGPEQRAELFERLGNLQAWQLDDAQAAAGAWLEGARLSEAAAADEARARRLYERVLGASPDHEEAAERLFELTARAADFAALSEPIEALLRISPERAAALLLEVEEAAVQAGAGETMASLTEAALSANLPAALVRRLEIAKARALARTPGREDAAAAELRTVLEAGPEDALGLAETFDAFLRAAPPSPARIADRRWLFAWRAERTGDKASVLLSWASAEQNELGDTEAAARLYEWVLQLDPERTEALTELSKLRVAHGDAEGALRSLSALRERMGPEMRVAIELEMAALLVEQLRRPLSALELVAADRRGAAHAARSPQAGARAARTPRNAHQRVRAARARRRGERRRGGPRASARGSAHGERGLG